MDIRIDFLADHPHLAEALARWSWEEWRSIYEQRGETFADAVRRYQDRLNRDRIPLTLVALVKEESEPHGRSEPDRRSKPNGRLIGTVSLKKDDLPIRPELNPWLGGVFVSPKWRRHGVASMLMRRVVDEAARLKIPRLFLWTYSAEGLYEKLGWTVVERMDYCQKRIVVMEMAP